MATTILKVVSQGEQTQLQKQDGSTLFRCPITLKELGGQYANEYAATLLGPAASLRFYPGDVVAAELTFFAHEYEGRTYQDVVVKDIVKLNN